MVHKFKVLPKEEVLNNRCNAYEFIDFDKQETLEEAAKRMYGNDEDGYYVQKRAFKIGAKWQQERSYSEEEVLTIAKDAYSMGRSDMSIRAFNEWFEQFKNK